MSDCIFCKIANGEISSNTIFENERFRVILDIAPANPGHCLVLPKKHALNIFEIDSESIKEAFEIAKNVAGAVKKAMNADGINILQNNGEAAGQTVEHFHIHIIPRYKNDTVIIQGEAKKLQDSEFIKIKKAISECIK